MIIDGHSHVTLPVEVHLNNMEKAGINKTILFSTTFHPELSQNANEVIDSINYLNDLLSGKKGSLLQARTNANTELLKTIQAHPTKYLGFGSVPAGLSLEETSAFIQTNICENGFLGMGEFTFGAGKVSLMEPVFLANEYFFNLPIWIHGFYPLERSDIYEIASFAKRFPKTPVILGHLGGFYWTDALTLAKEIPNLYLDTSAYYSTFVLKTIINEVPEKCIFGVDVPFGDLALSVETIKTITDSPQVLSAVFEGTISKILKL